MTDLAPQPASGLAAQQDVYGPPELVRVVRVPVPEPGADRVRIRVHAASVNRADLDYLRPRPGFIRFFTGFRRPRDPFIGLDAAGVVEVVGPEVTRFRPGDRVYADLYPFRNAGAFAELATAPERAFQPIPDTMSFVDAATLPHSATLAVQGLRRRDGRTVEPGQRVLVDGASGNVGPFAVQIAKARGAHVTAVCSADKMDFVRSLGADEVLDYRATDYTRLGQRWDWILDTDSHHPIRRARRCLRPGGTYVTLGGTAWPIIAALVLGPLLSRGSDRWSGLLLWWKPFDADDVRTIEALVASGAVRPAIDRRFPLTDVASALRWVLDGRNRGKVLVLPSET